MQCVVNLDLKLVFTALSFVMPPNLIFFLSLVHYFRKQN